MVVKRPLAVGDSVKCGGERVTIGKILFQDAYHCNPLPGERGVKDYYDIEFEDEYGKYRHWRSNSDGGIVILNSNAEKLSRYLSALSNTIDYLMSCSRNLRSAVVESNEVGGMVFRLNYSSSKGIYSVSVPVDSNFNLLLLMNVTPDLSMFIAKFKKDISNLVALNKNIGVLTFSIGSNIKYFTKLDISKNPNGENVVMLS